MMEHLNFRAIPISQRRSRVKCLTHTLLRVVMFESESWILRGKLKGLTVLRALSDRLIKSDVSAKLAGSNLTVSWKSIWKLDDVFTTYIILKILKLRINFFQKFTLRFPACNSIIKLAPPTLSHYNWITSRVP